MSDAPNIRNRAGEELKCSSRGEHYLSECLVCHARIVIHCDSCGTQITGCTCTIRERVKKELKDAPQQN